MAFITLHEALDRVLEKLAVDREGKGAGGIEPPAKVAREGRSRAAQREKPGCDWGLANHVASPRAAVHGGQTHQRIAGRPGGRRE